MKAFALTLAFIASACASAPPAPPLQQLTAETFGIKMAMILRLEDQRMLHDPLPPPAPAPATVASSQKRGSPAVAPPRAPLTADLIRLLADGEARVRRRAALAVGRVGLREGVPPLIGLLDDGEPEVRQMAAFALGLLGDPGAQGSLVKALADPSPLVQGSAAEALGLMGNATAAQPISSLMLQIVQSGALAETPGDDADARRDTPASVFRLSAYALARLKAYDQLAAAVLDGAGQPLVRWWPAAYALERLQDKRSLPALVTLARDAHPYTRAFAVKGLGALQDRRATPVLLELLSSDRVTAMESLRALARIGDPAATEPLMTVVRNGAARPDLRVEALAALSSVKPAGVSDTLMDLLPDPNPAVRIAALQALASLDPESFITVLSGLDPDPVWSARAALANALSGLSPEAALPRLGAMLTDEDQRVIPAVLRAMAKLHAPNLGPILIERLNADDPVVRSSACEGLGELKPPGGATALAGAYRAALRDATYVARAAALSALAKYGEAEATPVLRSALGDKDWAIRVKAASLLKELSPTIETAQDIRPAPSELPRDAYGAPRLIDPQVSPQVYLDTDRGTIQIELAVLDAPLTVENFVTLARKGFFNGLTFHRVVPGFLVQTGDIRGDGEGGPGYTIRDEINQRPFLRGAVGMALDGPETGGSQFFITVSPQPSLDATYTVFGRVVAGMDFIDQLQQGDAIRRVRVWDGVQMTER